METSDIHVLALKAEELSSSPHTGGFNFSPGAGSSHHVRGDAVQKPCPALRKPSLCRERRSNWPEKQTGEHRTQSEVNRNNRKEDKGKKKTNSVIRAQMHHPPGHVLEFRGTLAVDLPRSSTRTCPESALAVRKAAVRATGCSSCPSNTQLFQRRAVLAPSF